MSKPGKIFFGIFFLGLIAFGFTQMIVQIWNVWMLVPLVIGLISLGLSIVTDFAFFKEWMTLKTTKHGLSMGTTILLFVVLLVAVNYIGAKNNKKWDLTEEKLFSLSEQSQNVIAKLDSDLYFKAFYRKGNQEHENIKARLKQELRRFRQSSKHVKSEFLDPMQEPALARELGMDEAGGLIVEYKGRRATVNSVKEEDIMNAIIKVLREEKKILYFTVNHGELDFESQEGNGGKTLKTELENASYDVRTLSLVDTKATVPADADAVLILGPKVGFLPAEVQAIADYIKTGGRVLLALDPMKEKLGPAFEPIFKELGVKYSGNIVLDEAAGLLQEQVTTALGMAYSDKSEITNKIAKAMSLFYLASHWTAVENPPQGLVYEEIVKTSPSTLSIKELQKQITDKDVVARGPFALVATVSGKIGDTEIFTILFGDSDIFSNQRIYQQINRDIVLNSIAALAKDEDLISVIPKTAKNNELKNLTQTKFMVANILPFFAIPFLLMIFGGFLFFKRRGA